MPDDQNIVQDPVSEESFVPVSPQEPTLDAPIPQPIPPIDSTLTDMPSVALEGSGEAVTSVPVEDQNGVQAQPLVQQNQVGFIQSLLIKAQAKIQFNKQKKLEKLIQFAQEKGVITNDNVQKLLRVSDATATRYLVKLVEQGRLARVGNPRDAKYQFLG